MKKLLLLTLFLLLFSVVVSAQETALTSDITKVVTKESFKTRDELKNFIDEKSSEYNANAEKMINEGISDIKSIVLGVANKILMKAMLGIFSIILFSGGLWYFLRLKLEQQRVKIMALQQPNPKVEEKDKKEEKVVETSQKPLKKSFAQRKSDEINKQAEERQKRQDKLFKNTDFKEYQEFKKWKGKNGTRK